MFADSFRLVSIHCLARGLGAASLYKCPASRDRSLRQHDLLVALAVVQNYWWYWLRHWHWHCLLGSVCHGL